MRVLLAAILALSLVGCGTTKDELSADTINNADGSKTTTTTTTRTVNGKTTGTKTERTLGADGKTTAITKYTKDGGDWVKE